MSRLGMLLLLGACSAAAAGQAIELQNDYVTYTIGADGKNRSFRCRRTGKEYAAAPSPFATIRKGKERHDATACTLADGRITVAFGKSGITAVVKATSKKRHFTFEVVSVSGPAVDQLTLGNLAVTPRKYVSGMSGVAADDEFAVAIRALSLQMAGSVVGRPPRLAATCYRQYGLAGARMALAGCPTAEIRTVLQDVLRTEGVLHSPLGGPFALDAEENRSSYVFATVSEKNVDGWIALCKKAGIAQVHFSGWARSLGHYEPRKDLFPNGLAGLKATVDKIHAAGLKAGMHTLAGCISPHDSWVTPVPDPRLAADATYALAGPVDEKEKTIPTVEQPQQHDTMWAYAGHGNVVRIDDELIYFTTLSRTPPYAFGGCRRGAFGTKAAPHAKGAAVKHLYVRYGSFQPGEDTTLVDGVADAIANVFNTCGFDMLYMDGAEGSPGGWHGVAKMRAAIFSRLRRRCLVEASSWGTSSWPFHSRIGAWDHPKWGIKRFIDIHCRATESYRRTSLLPAQLGWWSILGHNQNHDAQTPDEIEYLCTKSLAYDAPMSFQGVRPGGQPPNARQEEYLALIGRYERLRLARHFPEAVRQRLREAGREFRLAQAPGGGWQFVPTDYAEHKVTALDDGSASWTVANRFGEQPAKLRIKALYAVEPYDSAGAIELAAFAKPDEFTQKAKAPSVTHALAPSAEQVKVGKTSGRYTATNTAATRRGTWAKMGKLFAPHVDMRKHAAFGLWIHGDGKGELLNLQLVNPRQYYYTLDEHYVKIDFQGWRYVELLLRERDADQHGLYAWPYAGHYAVYRAPLVRNHVSELNLYLNHLPPKGSVTCTLSPIKALPIRKVELRNPSITIRGRRIVFPVTLASSGTIEFRSPTDCTLYDERGARIQDVRPQGDVPTLAAGDNPVTFACDGPAGVRTRVAVTVITDGAPFGPPAPAAGPPAAK
ncbi:hypothetical protein HQ576_04940 [bacterium]|nr:hypothetical protein [bacterium]